MKSLRLLRGVCLGSALAASTTVGYTAEPAGAFDQARTELEAACTESDAARPERLFEKTPAQAPTAGATAQLGAELIKKGRTKLQEGLAADGENRQKLMAEARKYFDEAGQNFIATQKSIEAASKVCDFDPSDARRAERDRMKGDLIQSHMFQAYGLYEKSRTYDSNNEKEKKEWDKALRTAADKYGAIYKDYRTLIAGLAARLKEGQCYQELKDTKRALGLFSEILGQPDELKPLRPYKAQAMYFSLQCWNEKNERHYELAYRCGNEFIKTSEPGELVRPEWLSVRYFTALSCWNRVNQLSDPKPTPEGQAEMQRCFDFAQQHAKIVAATQNEHQDAARKLLKELLGNGDSEAEAAGAEKAP